MRYDFKIWLDFKSDSVLNTGAFKIRRLLNLLRFLICGLSKSDGSFKRADLFKSAGGF